MTPRDWALALLVVLAWGLNFLVIRLGLQELPPLLLGGIRFLIVAFPAMLFIKPPKMPIKWLLAYGITISFGQFALLFSAMHLGMPAGLASLVLQAQMLFTMFFALIFLGERWKAHQFLSLLIAAAGLTLLATQHGDTDMTLIGFTLTIAAAASWGLGNIVNRHISQITKGELNLMSLVIWGAVIPPIPFFIASYYIEGPELILQSLANASWHSVASLIYLAFIATMLGYGIWAYLLGRYPASLVAPLTLLVPIIGLLSAWLVLGESLNAMQALGILVIMLGLLINVFGGRIMGRLKRRST